MELLQSIVAMRSQLLEIKYLLQAQRKVEAHLYQVKMRRVEPLQSLVLQELLEVLQMLIHKELPLVAPLQKANKRRARIRLAMSSLSFHLLQRVV